ncbi:MAG: hypothetical protein ACUVRK_10015 [Spirochaetota bacterium]
MKIRCMTYIVLLISLNLAGCSGVAFFDNLAGSNITMIIKGTFESTTHTNSIKNWDTTVSASQSIDDSVNDCITDNFEQFPTTFMVDIAEIRLAKPDGSDADKVANYRQVFTARVSDDDPFFSGRGVVLKCDDIKPGKQYGMVKLFIRKLVFDNATQWHIDANGTVVQDSNLEVIFHEETVKGFDFNQVLVNTFYDTLKNNDDKINRVFPLEIPIDGGLIVKEGERVVLEIRLIIKNFIKLYEYDLWNDNLNRAVYHYWAVSDWLRDVQPDDVYMGGNLLGVARVYKKDAVATVRVTTSSSGYVMAIPRYDMYGNEQDIADYFLDDDDTSWKRPVYEPHKPVLQAPTIERFLDYYLRYEQYKVEYNTFVTAVNNASYENDWNSYDGYKCSLRLPPLVAHTDTGNSYSLTDVPYGEYKFYFIADGNVPYGKLPQETDSTTIQPYSSNPITVNGDTTVNF